jgi:hypothetical protein
MRSASESWISRIEASRHRGPDLPKEFEEGMVELSHLSRSIVACRAPMPAIPRNSSSVVGGAGDSAAGAGPVGVDEFASGLVDALVGVGAEVVALGLE